MLILRPEKPEDIDRITQIYNEAVQTFRAAEPLRDKNLLTWVAADLIKPKLK
jgi:L-amino acid N-acyltransferase YncA